MAKKHTANKEFEEYKKNPPQTLDDHPFYGLFLDADQRKFRDAIWNPEKLIIFADCKAGTGKTTIATATADLLVKYGLYDGIVFIAAPVQEQKMGFLPGDLNAKSLPYFEHFIQALLKIDVIPERYVNQLIDIADEKNAEGYIDMMAHTYLRGCNFEKKVVIIDETQNMYADELKKVLTRIHDDCKVIVVGHSGQIDLYEHPEHSGFIKYIKHFKDDPRTSVCTLTKNYRGWISSRADELEF